MTAVEWIIFILVIIVGLYAMSKGNNQNKHGD